MITVPIQNIISNPWQTRIKDPDPEYIKELALDIAKNGLLQIPIGRIVGDSTITSLWSESVIEMKMHEGDGLQIQLAFGHNRLAAFKWLNDVKDSSNLVGDWTKMPVDIRTLTDEQMAALAWSENEKRRDVTPIERAKAIQRRIDDFGWTNREAAEALGIDHSTLSNVLRLLKLPENFQEALQNGTMSERQAVTILILFDVPENSVYYPRKEDILYEALNGASSEKLRDQVNSYLKTHGKNLDQADFKVKQLIPEGQIKFGTVYCATCDACDKRLASRNLCFNHDCYAAKTDFVHWKYLEEASFISGYPIVDFQKGGVPSLIPYHQLDDLKATKCPNIVLAYSRDTYDQVPGFPHANFVCEKRNGSCTCQAGLRANVELSHKSAGGIAKDANGIAYFADEEDSEIEVIEDDSRGVPVPKKKIETLSDFNTLHEDARRVRKMRQDAINKLPEIKELIVKRIEEGLKNDQWGAFFVLAYSYTFPTDAHKQKSLDDIYHYLANSTANRFLVNNPLTIKETIDYANDRLNLLGMQPISLEKNLVEIFSDEVCAQTVTK